MFLRRPLNMLMLLLPHQNLTKVLNVAEYTENALSKMIIPVGITKGFQQSILNIKLFQTWCVLKCLHFEFCDVISVESDVMKFRQVDK